MSQKRYIVTDTLVTTLPTSFVRSVNRRYVLVREVVLTAITEDGSNVTVTIPQHYSLHADFIHIDTYLDSYVCTANRVMMKDPKYEQYLEQTEFKVWFKNEFGERVNVEDVYGDGKTKIKFVLKLLLIY